MERLLQDRQLPNPSHLVVGQTIVVQYPELTHTVLPGDSLYSIAQMHNTTVAQLLRSNPALQGRDLIYPGQTIVVKFASKPRGSLTANAYAYPSIDRDLLRATLPYLSQLTPFTYRFDEGELIPLRDEALVNAALQSRVVPIFHLSNLDEEERFSAQLAHELLEDEEDQRELIGRIVRTVDRRGYQGVDVDFEYLRAEKRKQTENRLKAGPAWSNQDDLVFTNELGRHYVILTFYKNFKKIAASIGRPDARPHDLRHTAATVAIASGADIKSVQDLLGHATASFTLNVYAHTSEQMMKDMAARMQSYYDNLAVKG